MEPPQDAYYSRQAPDSPVYAIPPPSQQSSAAFYQSKRYKYCCRRCKHSESGKKTCVCVVPLSQRRTSIGVTGCQTCGCIGCSIEDFESRGEDPQYKPTGVGEEIPKADWRSSRRQDPRQAKAYPNSRQQGRYSPDRGRQPRSPAKFTRRNTYERSRSRSRDRSRSPQRHSNHLSGCCRQCMRAFSSTGKACICQVPNRARKNRRLNIEGCKICGCKGCNPQDASDYSGGSDSLSRSIQRRRSRSQQQPIDIVSMALYNMDRSVLGMTIAVEYGLYGPLLGYGVPQRTPGYVMGNPNWKPERQDGR